jgi:hypothetical protein
MSNFRSSDRDYAFIRPLRDEHMKTWVKRDASMRVIILYEAPVHIGGGDPCLATVYYYEAASAQVTGSMERQAIWDASWDTAVDAILVNGDLGYIP